MSRYLKYAGFIRYKHQAFVEQHNIIEQFNFKSGNYTFSSVFFKENNWHVIQISTTKEEAVTTWRTYIDFSGTKPMFARMNYMRNFNSLQHNECMLRSSYMKMSCFWNSEGTPILTKCHLRRVMREYSCFLKKIESYVSDQIKREGFGYVLKYKRNILILYWLCKRNSHSRVKQLDKICPALLSSLAYGYQRGYFSLNFVDSIFSEIINGRSIKKISLRIFNFLLNKYSREDDERFYCWQETILQSKKEQKRLFINWWTLIQLGTQKNYPCNFLQGPPQYLPESLFSAKSQRLEELINVCFLDDTFRQRLPSVGPVDRSKEFAILVFRNFSTLKHLFRDLTVNVAASHLKSNPQVIVTRKMNALRALEGWTECYRNETDDTSRNTDEYLNNLNIYEQFTEPWEILEKDDYVKILETPNKMIEFSERIENCLRSEPMIKDAVNGRKVFFEALMGGKSYAVSLVPLNDSANTFRIGNVLGKRNKGAPYFVRKKIIELLKIKFKLS
jgi:hypothetical protein